MKTIHILTGAAALIAGSHAMAQTAQEIILPAETKEVSSAVSSAEDNRAFLVHNGAALTATGHSNTILANAGSAVTVTGSTNTIYVLKSGAVTITGDGNQIVMMPGAAVTDLGKGNTKRAVSALTWRVVSATAKAIPKNTPETPPTVKMEPVDPTPPDPKIAAAAKMLEGLGGGLEALLKLVPIGTDKSIDLAKIITPPADPAKPLQGAWNVVSATTDDLLANGIGVKVGGAIYFLPEGKGLLDATLTLRDTPLPWKGAFTWEETDGVVATQGKSATVLKWKRTTNAEGQHLLEWTTGAASKVTLTLQRRADG